ncbi:MAG: molybdopterin-dependent oxidoreductase [Spongiibacteraceae bacterium]|nr:molybdopterin-dependent oxidoreductase [Spongiibacteraceae bacterium]
MKQSDLMPAFDIHALLAEINGARPQAAAAQTAGVTAVIAAGPALDRRRFLKLTGLVGGGFALAFALGSPRKALAAATDTAADAKGELNTFVQVRDDGTILIAAKNPEMGQGVKTTLPMIIAEELDARWEDVEVYQSPFDTPRYGPQISGGSRSVPDGWDAMRQAGATARTMLVAAAAAQWEVPVSECRTSDSRVLHEKSGRSLSYGELAAAAARQPVPTADAVRLKDRSEWRLLGKRVTGVDNRAIVTGQPLFGIDQTLPGMRFATYVRCPRQGGRVRSANLDAIRQLPGIDTAFVIDEGPDPAFLRAGVAIVGDSTWNVLKAREQLKVEWDESNAAEDDWDTYSAQAEELRKQQPAELVYDKGDVGKAFEQAATTVEGFYTFNFITHAQLEPQNCTAWYRDGGYEFWAPTQAPAWGAGVVAQALGTSPDKVKIHVTRSGGGFGRRLINDFMCEAAAIAREVKAPVKLQWTREDDMRHDCFRPGGFQQLTAALDNRKKMTALRNHHITFTNDGEKPAAGAGYFRPEMAKWEFPAHSVDHYQFGQTMLPLKTPCGPWRAPFSNTLAWSTQSFLHEVSTAAGRDHLDFLLELMGDPQWLAEGVDYALNTGRAAAVIKAAAEKAGWGKPLPKGRGLGLAFYFSHAGHFAEVADVSVDADKRITIHRIVCVGDIGPVINLSGAESQCEGSILDGLSAMLGQEITLQNGEVQQTNFHQYPVLRMNQAVPVEIHFIESDFRPTGAGEPALPPLAPAVTNAVYAATGHRIRTLPIAREGFSIVTRT